VEQLIPERYVRQRPLHAHLVAVVARVGAYVVQVLGERAHVGGDGHLVVVEDDDEAAVGVAGVVEGLEGHAAGHRAVADHGHDVVVLPLEVPRHGHTVGGGDGGGGVPSAERVVDALVPRE